MSDKLTAGLVAAVAVVPCVLLCGLGPAATLVAAGSLLAWIGGPLVLTLILLVSALGWLILRSIRRAKLYRSDRAKVETQIDGP